MDRRERLDRGGVTVESLQMSSVSLINRTAAPIDLLTNRGMIGCLSMANVHVKALGGQQRSTVVRNLGTIKQSTPSRDPADNILSTLGNGIGGEPSEQT